MSDVQPIANFCWDTVSPVTPETEPQVEVTAFSVTGVDTRTGPVTITARDDSFGVADIYGEFGTNSCTVEAPEGVLIYDPSGTFGTPYGPKALLNASGTYYWRPGILEPGTDEEQKVLFRDYGGGVGGGGTPGSAGYVIWRPGGTTAGQVVATYAEIAPAIANGAVTLYIDSSLAPATTPGTGFAMPFFPGGIRGYNAQNASGGLGDLLTVADTDSLQQLRYVENLKIVFECTTSPALAYESNDLLWVNWGWLQMGATATVPAYTLPVGVGPALVVRSFGGALEGVEGDPVAPLFALTSTSSLILELMTYTYTSTNAVTGAAGCRVLLIYDSSSAPAGPFADNGGTTAVPIDSNESQTYGSGAANPATSPGGLPLSVGQPFYRTDLTIPVWYDGAAWRNAAAVVVP